MSEPEHQENASWIKTPKQLLIVVVIAFAGTVALILSVVHLATQPTIGSGTPGMSEKAIAKRLEPVGQFVAAAGGQAPAEKAAAKQPQPAPAAKPPQQPAPAAGKPETAAGGTGKAVFDKVCSVCHATGVAGAPKFGDKAAWAPRIKTGMDTLYQAALHGKGAMPPKGGHTELADADVKAAVDYMVDHAK